MRKTLQVILISTLVLTLLIPFVQTNHRSALSEEQMAEIVGGVAPQPDQEIWIDQYGNQSSTPYLWCYVWYLWEGFVDGMGYVRYYYTMC